VDYTCLPAGWPDPPGLAAGLARLDDGMREWAGLAAYYLLGRSAALFPGP
jgi:hypothetical protein